MGQTSRHVLSVADQARLEALAATLDLCRRPFAAVHPDGDVFVCNSAYCRLVGRTEDELRAFGWPAATPPGQTEAEAASLSLAQETGAPICYESERCRSDGTCVRVSVLAQLGLSSVGPAAPVCTYPVALTTCDAEGIGLDEGGCAKLLEDAVSRERAYNQQLLAITHELEFERTRLRTVIDSTPEAIVVCDEQGRVILTNPAAERLFGRPLPHGESLGSGAALGLYGGDGTQCDARRLPLVRSALDGEVIEGAEMALVVAGGRRRDLLVSTFPIRSRGGAAAGAVGVFQDVTDRRQFERDQERLMDALLEERERLAVTLRSIGDGVIVCNTSGAVVLMNGVAEALTGWSEDEALGRQLDSVFVILNERTGERAADPVRRVLQTGQVQGLANHTILVSRDGTRYALADSGAPVRDREGRIVGVVLVFQDVTRRQKLEEEVAKANKLESLGVLAGGIAHDFNNLLTGIMGNIILARMEAEGNQYLVELLLEAEKASSEAKEITQQLLTFAKGGMPLRKTVNIEDVVTEAARFVLRGSKCRPSFDIAPDLWPVFADVGQIRQVVQNLVINADEAMPKGGTVAVRANNVDVTEDHGLPLAPGRYVSVTVADQGVGVAPDILPRVFDPYFTTKQKGSGLGLSVVYSIVAKHDGHVAVESELGRGSRFTVYLPAATLPSPRHATRPTAASHAGRVLLMDDEDTVRNVAKRLLEHLGYEVEATADGGQAIEAYAQAMCDGRPFRAVVLDLVVPGGLGGCETLQRLLEMDPSVCALVCSGYCIDPVMRSHAQYGFRAAIAKPFNLAELESALAMALGDQSE